MINKEELIGWLHRLTEDYVAIDEGGLNLVELSNNSNRPTKAYLEVGGIPEEEYTVVVGNIGTLYCKSKEDADETFREYVEQSKTNYGRAGGEQVALCHGGEPMLEYFPPPSPKKP